MSQTQPFPPSANRKVHPYPTRFQTARSVPYTQKTVSGQTLVVKHIKSRWPSGKDTSPWFYNCWYDSNKHITLNGGLVREVVIWNTGKNYSNWSDNHSEHLLQPSDIRYEAPSVPRKPYTSRNMPIYFARNSKNILDWCTHSHVHHNLLQLYCYYTFSWVNTKMNIIY